MVQRPAPLPGEGIPQAVYALTENIQRRLTVHFQGMGLHWGLRRILQQLWIADGLSQVQLAQAVRSSEASASNMLKHLVRDGWVERRRDPYDYRVSRVFLTQQGRALRDAIEQECARIGEEVREALGARGTERLMELLASASDCLSGEEGDRGDRPDASGIYDALSPPGEL